MCRFKRWDSIQWQKVAFQFFRFQNPRWIPSWQRMTLASLGCRWRIFWWKLSCIKPRAMTVLCCIVFWDLSQVLFLPQAMHSYVLFCWTHTVNEQWEVFLRQVSPLPLFCQCSLLRQAGAVWGILLSKRCTNLSSSNFWSWPGYLISHWALHWQSCSTRALDFGKKQCDLCRVGIGIWRSTYVRKSDGLDQIHPVAAMAILHTANLFVVWRLESKWKSALGMIEPLQKIKNSTPSTPTFAVPEATCHFFFIFLYIQILDGFGNSCQQHYRNN